LGVFASFDPPESRAERLVVRADAFSALLGSSAAVAVKAGARFGRLEFGEIGERLVFAVPIPSILFALSILCLTFLLLGRWRRRVSCDGALSRLFFFVQRVFFLLRRKTRIAFFPRERARSREQDDGIIQQRKRLRLSTRSRASPAHRLQSRAAREQWRLTLKVACSGGCMAWC
jgi:hypothetical protein